MGDFATVTFNDETTNDDYQSCAKVLLFGIFINTKSPNRSANYAVIQPMESSPPLPMHPSMPWLHADYLFNDLMDVSTRSMSFQHSLLAMAPVSRIQWTRQTILW